MISQLLLIHSVKFHVIFRLEEKKILDTIMGQDVYDSRIRPAGINGTGLVKFGWLNCCPKLNRKFRKNSIVTRIT